MTGTKLPIIPSRLTTWKKWRKKHPNTLVLTTNTGYSRDYSKDPYKGYFNSPLAFLGFGGRSPGLPEKELVLGLEIDNIFKAYPFSLLKRDDKPIRDRVNGEEVIVHLSSAEGGAYVTRAGGKIVPSVVTYWFVWYGFHNDTAIYRYGKK